MGLVRTIFAPKIFTGWHMFGVLFLFFGTIISVNMVLAFNAGSTWTGLVVKNTYVESQKFNERRDALELNQNVLGWQASADYDDGVLKIRLADKQGGMVALSALSGMLGRPVHEGDDQVVGFTLQGDDYVAPIKLNSGLWRVSLQAEQGATEWVKTLRFTVAPSGQAG